jgi:AbrB family looped-hinge helix DNA binding protein
MANINITRISSKGQIVIPTNMRDDLKEGDEILIIKDEGRFILKKAENITNEMREDLEFAKRTEEAWKQIEAGNCTSYTEDEFLKELEKW